MDFKKHLELDGLHAFLSASKYHWIRYDNEKLVDSYMMFRAKEKGTELHDFACRCIQLRQKLEKSKKTLNMYVNDAIGFKMTPEQKLVYSINCFGTADAISFRKNFLRIHDYKSGVVPAHMDQLRIYTALFCLEYNIRPADLEIENRIYQNDEILYDRPTAEDIVPIMDKILTFDKILMKIREEEV